MSTAITQNPYLLVDRKAAIVTITINRPEKLNAFTIDVWRDLGTHFLALSDDESVRCIVVRGAGEKAFSPGNDISEFETSRSNKVQAIEYGKVMRRTIEAMANCRHPIVAQIHGICVGGGLEIASLADVRICGTSSKFGIPIKNLGLVMSYSELAPLLRLVGPATALAVLLEGTIFDAQRALELGVVTRVVADAQVAEEATKTAERIAGGAPLVARWHKKFIRRLMAGGELTDAERDEAFDCFDTEDFQIGFRAFLQKETPAFKGR
ncbi:enoyl-CoA hydratase/isomerase family protein [Candidimonas sp. SYP-B2681]|uniref:enoyl-CoA hydratase/isomerase family protein n=1 Tax=Candidimonas sp. SYP-B2681 TaxID=2497686 RepID=UPI000F87B501|nr:enoyl-CoA hydratase-related protein [Candidimonas sp. SYP-B2681]RTZ45410.1 enoyl-CoA hydratase/isomerase family protein [Candidimonas sp. SYP-B2681]